MNAGLIDVPKKSLENSFVLSSSLFLKLMNA